MKNVIKKTVSAIASIVLGCSMITTSQVFADNSSYMKDFEERMIAAQQADSDLLTIVDSKEKSTCMQGMATDGTYIYVAKIKTDDSNVRIIRYNTEGRYPTVLKNKDKKDYIGSGHAGDMTAVRYDGKTYLLILNKYNGYSIIEKFFIDQNNETMEKRGTYKVNKELGGIAAEAFQNRNLSVDRYCNFYLKTGGKVYSAVLDMEANKNNYPINLTDANVIVGDWKRVFNCRRVWNGTDIELDQKAKRLNDCKSQGIGFYGSNSCKILYMVYSDKKGENFIIEYDLNSKDKVNRVFNAHEVTITNKKCKDRFEMESCVVIGTSTYYNTNCQKDGKNYDGIYRYHY